MWRRQFGQTEADLDDGGIRVNWLEPWWSTESQDKEFHAAFRLELESEVCREHVLSGISARLIARGNGDDALFELLDGSGRYAVVHLTWARHPEPLPWPVTEIYRSLDSFVNDRMRPEHSQFGASS